MTKHLRSESTTRPANRRPGRRPTTADKIVSAGLAATTCVGLVGVIAVRSQQDAAIAATKAPSPATSSTGLTQADLDAYAASLAQQQQALNDYRDQLASVATQMQAIADAQRQGYATTATRKSARSGATTSANVAVVTAPPAKKKKTTTPAKPRVRPQAPPQIVQPQTSTRSS